MMGGMEEGRKGVMKGGREERRNKDQEIYIRRVRYATNKPSNKQSKAE